MDIKRRFGSAVRARRTLLGISQEELALRIDADQAYVSRIEAGAMNVTLETAQQVAEALETDLSTLFLAAPSSRAGRI